ncbi:hypothetical protein PSPO01_16195 [Paraphaeosphaeria sporulosa]
MSTLLARCDLYTDVEDEAFTSPRSDKQRRGWATPSHNGVAVNNTICVSAAAACRAVASPCGTSAASLVTGSKNVAKSSPTADSGVTKTMAAASGGRRLCHSAHDVPSSLHRRIMSPRSAASGTTTKVVPPRSAHAGNMNNMLLPAPVSAAAFLRSWRTQGSPFAQEPGEIRPPAASRSRWQLSQKSIVLQSALVSAWSQCDRYEQELDIIHIKYRWAMAFLGKAYTEKIDQIRTQDAVRLHNKGSNRYGKGKVSSEAMDALLLSVSTASGPQQRQRFKRRLHQTLRWYEAAKQLGWGMLCPMPHDVVTNSWVENDLRIRYWHIWLELVIKVNPVTHKASRALDEWFGSEGIAGGSISEKETLSIEANALTPATQVEEIEDSDMEASEAGDERGVEPAPAQSTARSPAPIRPMRQLTLLELCRPQK